MDLGEYPGSAFAICLIWDSIINYSTSQFSVLQTRDDKPQFQGCHELNETGMKFVGHSQPQDLNSLPGSSNAFPHVFTMCREWVEVMLIVKGLSPVSSNEVGFLLKIDLIKCACQLTFSEKAPYPSIPFPAQNEICQQHWPSYVLITRGIDCSPNLTFSYWNYP